MPIHKAHVAELQMPRCQRVAWELEVAVIAAAAYFIAVYVSFFGEEDRVGGVVELGQAKPGRNRTRPVGRAAIDGVRVSRLTMPIRRAKEDAAVLHERVDGSTRRLISGGRQVVDRREPGVKHPAALHPGAPIAVSRARAVVVIVPRIHNRSHSDLPQVGDARGLLGRRLGLGENREEDRGKNSDDRNHPQQFDERKGFLHKGTLSYKT